ncbi:fatty acyl-CoA reductase 1-like [Thrips palmi]|uniref:Fatty acyl-CoA reductase n=1 Tax=Thrips palmi TaxID=161013 RepID=A0A6P8YYL3_THRPL|nr:fatty acyl-CoA reductase 1-like [Thrips palmi]
MPGLKVGHPHNAECRAVRDAVFAARRQAAAAGWPEVPGHTRVPDFFVGRTLLLTGATGFLGRLVLEQVLRTCPDVEKVYVVMRPKRGLAVQERLRVAISDPLFDRLRKEKPGVLERKVHALAGEIAEPRLGLSEEDAALVCREVSVFFNVAASVRFTEPIKKAVLTNVASAKEAVELAKAMPNLKVMIHVSTAYTNTNQPFLEECVYPTHLDWRTVLKAVNEIPDPDTLTLLGPKLLGFQPNSYTFSKALAEQVVNEARSEIPVVIVRPSIVLGTDQDPFPGWIDNLYGFSAFWVLGGKGIVVAFDVDGAVTTNLIPGDCVAKTVILAAWAKGIGINLSSRKDYDGVEVVHSVTLDHMGVRLEEMVFFTKELMNGLTAFPGAVRSPRATLTRSKAVYAVLHVWNHLIFGCALDLLARLTGQKPRMLDIYRKCVVGFDSVKYFTQTTFRFSAVNQWRLQSLLLPEDTKDYCYLDFLTRKDSAEQYKEWAANTIGGIVKYCLHEEYDPAKSSEHMSRLWWIETAVQATLILIIVVRLWTYLF